MWVQYILAFYLLDARNYYRGLHYLARIIFVTAIEKSADYLQFRTLSLTFGDHLPSEGKSHSVETLTTTIL